MVPSSAEDTNSDILFSRGATSELRDSADFPDINFTELDDRTIPHFERTYIPHFLVEFIFHSRYVAEFRNWSASKSILSQILTNLIPVKIRIEVGKVSEPERSSLIVAEGGSTRFPISSYVLKSYTVKSECRKSRQICGFLNPSPFCKNLEKRWAKCLLILRVGPTIEPLVYFWRSVSRLSERLESGCQKMDEGKIYNAFRPSSGRPYVIDFGTQERKC